MLNLTGISRFYYVKTLKGGHSESEVLYTSSEKGFRCESLYICILKALVYTNLF